MAIDMNPLFAVDDRKGPVFFLLEKDKERVVFKSAEGHIINVFVLEEDICRVLVLPFGKQTTKKTWAITPGKSDVEYEGREKFDVSDFSLPDYLCEEQEGKFIIKTNKLCLQVDLNGFICQWFYNKNGTWQCIASDRMTTSYNFGELDSKVYHYMTRFTNDMYFGLGERAGENNRNGNRYRMVNVDAAFYSARTTDPLYKHIPFYMAYNKAEDSVVGIYYDTVAECFFDMGKERDNYHGAYRYFCAEAGDLDYYIIAGNEFRNVLEKYTWLTGRPFMPPKWSIGYSGSTMAYTEAINAQERMEDFLKFSKEHGVICDSFHLSSGYTTINDKRYVFNWNYEKFPNPKKFTKDYLENNVKVIANIKPALLVDHPKYQEAAEQNLFIKNEDGKPLIIPFWGGNASSLDFTNVKAISWWKKNIKEMLLNFGITSTWNDNNEFEVWQPGAYVEGFGNKQRAVDVRPLQTLLMIKSSRDAQLEYSPNNRPFSVSRAGVVGMHRYVQTWSGDNETSWETLKYNVKMGIGLSLSGVYNTGHDVGGFLGNAPDAELFLRWVQFGIFMPRFSIHSENSDDRVTEPWMYPEITANIRNLINFRYMLVPYFYDLFWRAHHKYQPIIRSKFYNFPEDPECYDENDDMMLGENLLVAAVLEPNKKNRLVYLPKGANWINYWTGEYYIGGKEIDVAADWVNTPLFVKEGSIIPLNVAEQTFEDRIDKRGFAIFPYYKEGSFADTCFEDDGESNDYCKGVYSQWKISVNCQAKEILFDVKLIGNSKPKCSIDEVIFQLPGYESRKVTLLDGKIVNDQRQGMNRVITAKLNL